MRRLRAVRHTANYSHRVERFAHLTGVDSSAVERFITSLAALPHEPRAHAPARHARHLAALWGVPLAGAGRATLFFADGAAVLALVPADRKVSAPRFRDLLGVADLRVLRGDRGVGRVGWSGLSGAPGALPAVPALFQAACWVDERVLTSDAVIVPVAEGRSVRLAPADYVQVTHARVARFSGKTRLLEGGGMIDEVVGRDGFEPS